MHRIAVAVASTVAGLIMLFSYPTSTVGVGAPAAAGSTGTAGLDEAHL